MVGSQSVIAAERPCFEVREDTINPRQDDVSGHGFDHMGIVAYAANAEIATPTIGFHHTARRDVVDLNCRDDL